MAVVTARAGESLSVLVERVVCAWSPPVVAMANQIDEGARLSAGDRVKVAIQRPYRRR